MALVSETFLHKINGPTPAADTHEQRFCLLLHPKTNQYFAGVCGITNISF